MMDREDWALVIVFAIGLSMAFIVAIYTTTPIPFIPGV
jgi:hypothetical protein